MAYTPVGWQTGDTITADRLNRMDSGWSVETTELFSETVTTVESSGVYSADLAYSQLINADTITVNFDGTEYTCLRIDNGDSYVYGGFNGGPDFAEYPFFIWSGNDTNQLIAETAGTHTIAVSTSAVQTSADFDAAANDAIASAIASVPTTLLVTIGTTTWSQVNSALKAGRPALVWNHTTQRNQPDTYEFVARAMYTSWTVYTLAVDNGAVVVNTYQAASKTSALDWVTS